MISDDDWYEREQLHIAAEDGDLERVKQLLAEGRDINAFDDLSRTPLHYAAEAEDLILVQFLIEAGANVNAYEEEKIGETPLGMVAAHCSSKLARILLEAGADPTIKGFMDNTAIDRARDRTDSEGPAVHDLLIAASKQPR